MKALSIDIGKKDLKPSVILLGSALLLTLQRYFGFAGFANSNTGMGNPYSPTIFMFASAFFLLGIIPVCIIWFVFKERCRDYGLCIGDKAFGFKSVFILFPVIAVALLLPASQTPEMRNFYPFDQSITSVSSSFIQLQLWRGILFYSAWEFFFRGFMLFGLRKYGGDWFAICIQTIPQCLWHIGMPTGEILSSILGGILFGFLALRTGSILWPFILHYLIGITMDSFIILT